MKTMLTILTTLLLATLTARAEPESPDALATCEERRHAILAAAMTQAEPEPGSQPQWSQPEPKSEPEPGPESKTCLKPLCKQGLEPPSQSRPGA